MLWPYGDTGFFHNIRLVSAGDILSGLGWIAGKHMTMVTLVSVEHFVKVRAFFGWREDGTRSEYDEEIEENHAQVPSGGGHVEMVVGDVKH